MKIKAIVILILTCFLIYNIFIKEVFNSTANENLKS